MRSTITKIGVLAVLIMMVSCGSSRRAMENGFGEARSGSNAPSATERFTDNGDLGSNCPVTNFSSDTGAPIIADVFWPFEFDVLNLRADGNGYYILYEDLAMLGIGGVNPCNLLQIEYGIDSTGAPTGTGYYDFYTRGNGSGISGSCKNHIESTSLVAMITEDPGFDNSCAVFF
jgi:hypothetical protein